MKSTEAEVCVVGGGPAGSTIARRLAQLGHDVLLLERHPFPRRHVGESLTPGILPLLDTLSVRARIEEARFFRPARAFVQWAEPGVEIREHGGAAGFQVDRGRFDGILWAAAEAAGARTLQPAAAGRASRAGTDRWHVPVRMDDGDVAIRARFVIDATGSSTWLDGRVERCSAPTLALYGYWHGVPIQGPETRVEAGSGHWYWGAPLPDGSFNAAVFLDPQRLRAAGPTGVESEYRSLLAESELLAACLEGRLTGGVTACDASSRAALEPVGPDWIRVGDATLSIDPLSSQGVQVAMRTALQGATVVHTLLRRPERADAALAFYRRRQAETVAQHRALAGRFYAEPTRYRDQPFWHRRAAVDTSPDAAAPETIRALTPEIRIGLSNQTRLVDTPVIRGDLIVLETALEHPALDRPVAFLGEIAVAPLLATFDGERRAADVLAAWSDRLPANEGWKILSWMWRRGVAVEA